MKNKPKPTGRPRREIDLEMVKKLAMIQCTIVEIAYIMEIGRTTLEKSAAFRNTYKKAVEDGRMSLRRLQWSAANGIMTEYIKNEDGSPRLDEKGRPFILRRGMPPSQTMLVWLGKQYLGQQDKTEITGDPQRPVEFIVKYDRK